MIRGVAAALIRRSKLPLGIGAQRILRGPSPWVGYRVEPVSTGGAPEPHAVFVCPVDLQIPFLDELPQALRPTIGTGLRRCKWSMVRDEFGTLGEPDYHYRNSRWHDNSLQATGDVRRVVGRLGKGGTAWNEGSCGRGSHQGNQRVVTFVETEVGAPRRTSPTGHQRNASSTR